jgi:hypothetical protein
MAETNRHKWTDPAVLVVLFGYAIVLIGTGVTAEVQLSHLADGQDKLRGAIENVQAQDQSSVIDLKAQVQANKNDYDTQLYPKRVQVLEDNADSDRRTNAAQFLSINQSINAIQQSYAQTSQTLQASVNEIAKQVTTQSTTVALIGQQVSEMLSGPTVGKKR